MGLHDRSPSENAEMTGLRHFIDGMNKYGDKYLPFNIRHNISDSKDKTSKPDDNISASKDIYDPEGEIFIESLSSEEKSDIAITLKNTYDGASKDQILYAMTQIKMQLKNTKDRAERERLKEKLSILKILYASAKSVEKKIDRKVSKKNKK
jgi:hypothetical protein